MDYVEDHEVSHVVDSHRGIYSAETFVERFGEFLRADHDIDALRECIDDCCKGPGSYLDPNDPRMTESYAEAWQWIIDNAEVRLRGKRFGIHENEGIYLVRDDVEWCDECDWFASADCDCPHVQ